MSSSRKRKAVSIKDVAQLARVSPAAVSYALNNTGGVSQETIERVLEAARQLNYRPNSIARSLKTNRTHSIGVVVEDITVFNTPAIIDGINASAERHGYSIILSNLMLTKRIDNDLAKATAFRGLIEEKFEELYSKKVEGIIYVGVHSRDVTELVGEVRLPVVYVYATSSRPSDYFVTYDDRVTGYRAMRYLLDAGHRAIGFIIGPKAHSETSRARLLGCQDALVEHHLEASDRLIVEGDWGYESGYLAARKLLTHRGLSAIFAMNDLMALGAMAYCLENHVTVPDHISVIGIDNRESSRYFVPRLTTMAIPLREMGEESAEMIIKIINNQSISRRALRLPGQLVERDSVSQVR